MNMEDSASIRRRRIIAKLKLTRVDCWFPGLCQPFQATRVKPDNGNSPVFFHDSRQYFLLSHQ